jgi:hypothetical protein
MALANAVTINGHRQHCNGRPSLHCAIDVTHANASAVVDVTCTGIATMDVASTSAAMDVASAAI